MIRIGVTTSRSVCPYSHSSGRTLSLLAAGARSRDLPKLMYGWISSLPPCRDLLNSLSTDHPQNHVKISVPRWTNDCPFGRCRAWKRALWVSRPHPVEAELATSKQLHARAPLAF